MKINSLILFFFSVLLINCNKVENTPGTQIVDISTGFTMTVPSSFKKLNNETKKEQLQRGKNQLNKLHEKELQFDSSLERAKMFQYDGDNLFLLNTKNYDISSQGNYDKAIKELNQFAYQTQSLNFPTARIDSLTSKETIDGVKFIKYIINAKISENKTMHLINYYHLFGNNADFTASIVFTDEELGKEILKAFKASKFKK